MNESLLEALGMPFFQHAMTAAILLAVAVGVVGPLSVANRLSFLSGGIAHATFAGVGAALFFGVPILLGSTVAALAAAGIISFISYRFPHRSDATIGAVWSVGMALGVVLSDLTPGYNVDGMSFLFGSILAVDTTDLWLMALFDAVLVGTVWLFYYDFLALSYDPVFAKLQGVPTRALHLLELVLIAMTVVFAMRLVGLIMVIALLTMPAFAAERYTKTLAGMMKMSVLLAALYLTGGLLAAFWLDISSGAAVILTAAFGTIALFLVKKG